MQKAFAVAHGAFSSLALGGPAAFINTPDLRHN